MFKSEAFWMLNLINGKLNHMQIKEIFAHLHNSKFTLLYKAREVEKNDD